MKSVFVGSNGLRAGWRVAAFLLLTLTGNLVLLGIVAVVMQFAGHTSLSTVVTAAMSGAVSPAIVAMSSGTTLGAALAAASIMARSEQRRLDAYGLALRGFGSRNFFEGIVAGFGAITLIIAAMNAVGIVRFGGFHEAGIAVLADALAWALAFLALGLSEEFIFRGYLQFTLTTGTRFWFAALLTSLAFALAHTSNHGETVQGIAQIIVFALVMCFALWRSGDLWFGVGLHAAWDWGQTFFYGTPDSGLVTSHSFLATTFSGPAWLSGASAGPEGSVFSILALLAVTAYLSVRFRGRRYLVQIPSAASPAALS